MKDETLRAQLKSLTADAEALRAARWNEVVFSFILHPSSFILCSNLEPGILEKTAPFICKEADR